MSEFVPVALACGHVLQGMGVYEIPAVGSPDVARVECPEGCGFQEYVIEPGERGGCLCQPGRHVCGDVETLVFDLGELRGPEDEDDE